MVEASDLVKAMQLKGEWQTLRAALDGFDRGDVINAMTIGPKQTPEQVMAPPMGVTVSTIGIAYPAQMVDSIKGSLQTRQAAVEQDLKDLGVTGIEEDTR